MVRFRHLAAATLGSTYVLMLLGLYTAGTATGLTCGAQWPTCGGGPFGLFPPNLISFAEWTHRLVAMLTGVAILGTAGFAWRRSRAVAVPATLAAALLPLQVGIGALTVTLDGLVPGGFSPPVQVTHFSVALFIFSFLIVTAIRAYDGDGTLPRATTRYGALFALACYPLVVLFARDLVFTYTAAVQVAYYGAGLAAAAALLVVSLRAAGPLRTLAAVALATLVVQLLLGRGLFVFTGWVPLAYLVVTGLLGPAVGAVAWTAVRDGRVETGPTPA